MNAKEAWEKRTRSSSPERARELDALAACVQVTDDRPDAIIGGDWPAVIPGARRESCRDCGAYVALSPQSGAMAAAKYPDVPVLCFDCAKGRAAKEAK
jgi:hypothetical protein